MNGATGPSYTLNEEELNIGDANYVQEALALIGTNPAYALLGYVPATARSVQIFADGAFLLQGVDYTIDGRKLSLGDMTGVGAVTASYITTNAVASIPAVEIAFEIPGQNVRVGVGGVLQALQSDGYWHDMVPATNPITGAFTLEVDQAISLNQ